jgi:hypothetical protein
MTRFYFHLEDRSGRVADEEGVELPDVDSAHRHALQAARLIICDEVVQGRVDLSQTILVEDQAGRRLVDLRFRDALAIDG